MKWNKIVSASLCGLMVLSNVPLDVMAANGNWVYQNGWSYVHSDGSKTKNGLETIDGKSYYFDGNAHYVTGWKLLGSNWYYFDLQDGHMLKNAWVGSYYLGANGILLDVGWKHDANGWRYIHEDGSYTKNDFEDIQFQRYYFDSYGYYVRGWKQIGSNWHYFFFNDGHMAMNQWVDGNYFDVDGVWIPLGWQYQENGWRYIHKNGKYTKNDFEKIDQEMYYFDAYGHYVRGWQYISGNWYYFYWNDGHMAHDEVVDGSSLAHDGRWIEPGWKQDSTGRYYLKPDGTYPVTSFETINGKTYYFNASGYMVTGWQELKGSHYYFYEDGHMAQNEHIDGQYVYGDGHCDYHDAGWFYVDSDREGDSGWRYKYEDGSLAKGFTVIGGKTYYFDCLFNNMITGFCNLDHAYYYFYGDGHMAMNEWIDDRYYGNDGRWQRTGWQEDQNGGMQYYLPDYSYVSESFYQINGYWYYFDNDGLSVFGWKQINDKWYCFVGDDSYPGFEMLTDTYRDGYYIDANGVCANYVPPTYN